MDLLDAKTSRHTGACEFASETDAAVLRAILKVKDGAGGGYWWGGMRLLRGRLAGCARRRERRVTNESAAAQRWVGRCLPGAIFLGPRTYPPVPFGPIPAR
jgi:hypothetical protein